MHTRLCELLDIGAPVFSAPMGPDLTGPELVAAVSDAGGFGILQAQLEPPEMLRQTIRRVRQLTDRPFAVNFILHFPSDDGIAVCLEEVVPALSFFWGDAAAYVPAARATGVKTIHQVGTVRDAAASARAGIDVIIAQGMEAGGHVAGEVSTMVLVPRVVDAVAPTPVVAAGGIADGRGLAAALMLGADGVALGTRFLATPEARAHPQYKQRVLEADETRTVRTLLFGNGWPDAPHRVLRTPFVEQWMGDEQRGQHAGEDEPIVGKTCVAGRELPLPRFTGLPPNVDATGDLDCMGMMAGQSVGLVHSLQPAGDVVRQIVAEAETILRRRMETLDGGDSY